MDQVQEVKEALNASSRSTTVDELKARGRQKVKVVRAEQIAAMISEAVQRTVSEAGLLSPDEHEQLVERSRDEFKSILKQREQEVKEARRAAEEMDDLRQQLEAAHQRANELHEALEEAQQAAAQVVQASEPVAGPAVSADTGALSDMLEKLTGSINERLDKFGRKIGISSAVEADEVKFDNLFNEDVTKGLESNMDDVQVKKKSGSGIADNLEKLKKLKGDG